MPSYEYWRGESKLDGSPIVLLVTVASTNRKTGDMVQTYILRQDMAPHIALKQGEDTAVCGDCPVRSKSSGGDGSCYVVVAQGPRSVWASWKVKPKGKEEMPSLIGRPIRMGTYGDPAAVPFEVWQELMYDADCGDWTGYTHQWQKPWAQDFKELCMASVDNEQEAAQAVAMGWRYFRVRTDDSRLQREIVCPASEEAGKVLQCHECLQCSGGGRKNGVNVVITVHGSHKNNRKQRSTT